MQQKEAIMSNSKFTALANDILEAAGGADNIAKVSHCFTRLRLDPVDLNKVDVEKLKTIKGSKGCIVNNGQA